MYTSHQTPTRGHGYWDSLIDVLRAHNQQFLVIQPRSIQSNALRQAWINLPPPIITISYSGAPRRFNVSSSTTFFPTFSKLEIYFDLLRLVVCRLTRIKYSEKTKSPPESKVRSSKSLPNCRSYIFPRSACKALTSRLIIDIA